MSRDARPRRILVIKLGALGDFVQAMGPAQAIRAHHGGAEITLLTRAPFADLARRAPYFDRVWVDERPSLRDPMALWRLRRRLKAGAFDRVYDLQTSDRSSWYFALMAPGPRPEWSGIARGASHRHANPERDRMHTLDRQADQLRACGIACVPPPDLGWAVEDLAGFDLPQSFVLLVPGGAAHRPEKRWPLEQYAGLARWLVADGVTPVLVGGAAEAEMGAAIRAAVPQSRDLTGRTGFGEVVALGARALHAVGNDTGPMHLVVAGGAPATVLYSRASDPALTAPRGSRVAILQRPDLASLTVADVAATLALTLNRVP
jgi:ADP-heptose:LPS heptosyltransferase